MKRKVLGVKLKINVAKAEDFNECNVVDIKADSLDNQGSTDEMQQSIDSIKAKKFCFDPTIVSKLQEPKLAPIEFRLKYFLGDKFMIKIKEKWLNLNFEKEEASEIQYAADEFLIKESTDDLICVYQNLFIANEATAKNEEILKTNKITHIINLVAHHEENKSFYEFKYLEGSLKDSIESDIFGILRLVINFIETSEKDEEQPRFLFYGKKGISRSVAILTGYMMYKFKLTLDDSLSIVRKQKPKIDPNIGFLGQLKRLEELIMQADSGESNEMFNINFLLSQMNSKERVDNSDKCSRISSE